MKRCDELTYDAEADALHISLACGWSARAEDLTTQGFGGVLVDLLDDAVPVGIEVLAASKHPVFSQLIPKAQGASLTHYRSGGVHA